MADAHERLKPARRQRHAAIGASRYDQGAPCRVRHLRSGAVPRHAPDIILHSVRPDAPTPPGPPPPPRPKLPHTRGRRHRMTDRFAGRTAIVTGGASGIGAGIAARLAVEGARLSLWDVDA